MVHTGSSSPLEINRCFLHTASGRDATERLLSIGEVAQQAGLRPSALRFYEEKGLIAPTTRVGGKRRYHPAVLRQLALIAVATRAGFTLAETGELLDASTGASSWQQWEDLAARKVHELEETIQRARTMQRLLQDGPFSVRRAGGRWGFPSPFAYRRGPGLAQASLLFDTLLWKDTNGHLLPWLAARWDMRTDGRAYRFVLRDDIEWADGVPLTADDVAFTVAYLTAGPGSRRPVSHARGLDAVRAVRVDGDDTVTFELHQPHAPFLEWVAGRMLVIPRHVWDAVSDPSSVRQPDATVGTGPYRLESCDEETGNYRYTAKQNYFRGVPYVRCLEFVPVRDALDALTNDEIDVAEFVSDRQRPGREQLDSLPFPDYEQRTHPGEWTRALHVNLSRGFPYDERRFRHALAHAIDQPRLIDALLNGLGKPASPGGLAPSHPCAASDLPTYEHDPTRAAALLDELGMTRQVGTGLRVLPDGAAFRPVLQTDAGDPGAADLVAAQLQEVGLEIRVMRVSPDEADTAAAAADYELALVGHGSLGGDPDLLRLQLSARAPSTLRTKAHGYHQPEVERLAETQRGCLDTVRRRQLLSELQHVVADDLPILPLYVPDRLIIAARQRVFDAWHFTPGGVQGGFPGSLNKHALVSGQDHDR